MKSNLYPELSATDFNKTYYRKDPVNEEQKLLINTDSTYLMPCATCSQTDIILKQNAESWVCPFCYFTNIQQKNVLRDIKRINYLSTKVNDLNEKVEDNMKRLNGMMKELMGVIAMVRPTAKKNDWYKTEIESFPAVDVKFINTVLEE